MEASDVRRTLSRLRGDQVLGVILGLLLVILLLDLGRQASTGPSPLPGDRAQASP